MNLRDNDIKRALAMEEAACDLDREEGVFRQMAGIFQGKTRWMAVCVTIESVLFLVLMVLAAIEFFRVEDTRWQIFYATGFLLMGMLLVLIKLWGWMQMNRHSIQREIKRLELRILEMREQK